MERRIVIDLRHYGIPGMHWGKMGSGSKIGSLRKAVKEASDVGKAARKDFIDKARAGGESSKLGSFRKANLVARKARVEHLQKIRKATSPEAHSAAVKNYADSIIKSASAKPAKSWLQEARTTVGNNFKLTNQADREYQK